MIDITKLRELLAKATPGTLILATSNSWRRIVTLVRSTPVCVPYAQHDGHPDLHFPNGGPAGPDATLLLEARNALPALLDEIDRLNARCDGRGEQIDRLRAEKSVLADILRDALGPLRVDLLNAESDGDCEDAHDLRAIIERAQAALNPPAPPQGEKEHRGTDE